MLTRPRREQVVEYRLCFCRNDRAVRSVGFVIRREANTPPTTFYLAPSRPSMTDLEQLHDGQPRFPLLFNDAESLQRITDEEGVSFCKVPLDPRTTSRLRRFMLPS